MSGGGDDNEDERATQFDRWMLSLSRHVDPAAIVREALQLVVDDAGASLGYLELCGDKGTRYAHACGIGSTELAAVHTLLSQTIMRDALAERRTIATPAAMTDVRFADLGSVRQNTIHAVLCVPIYDEGGSVGVLYLQRNALGPAFDARVRDRLHAFALAVALVARRLLRRNELSYRDLIDDYEEGLRRCESWLHDY